MVRIGLMSDTHGYLFKDSIERFFAEVDEIWHVGDIGNMEVIDYLRSIKPLRAVYGNIDGQNIRQIFPKNRVMQCEDVKVVMTHIGGYPGRYEKEALEMIKRERPKIFISGHSHILKIQYDKKNELLHINPGAAGKYGFHTVSTLIRFTIDGSDIKDLQIIEIKK